MFTIRKRLLVLGLSGILPILGVGGAAYQAILTHQREIQAMLTSGAALRNHGQAGMLHDALRADIFEALAATAPAERTRLRGSLATHARELREAVARNRAVSLAPDIAASLSRSGLACESYIGESEAIMALLERDRDAAVARLPRFRQAFESLEREQEEVSSLILIRNEAIEAHAAGAAANSKLLIGGLSLLAAADLGLAAWLLGRAIAAPLTGGLESISTGSRQVAAAAAQISDSAQKLAQVAGRQASALDETSASAEEVRALAEKSAGISATAASRTRETVEGVRRVNGALRETVVSMDEIVDSSSKISKIIKVIEEIAFQTNILALNAAVEAARAGEAGLGFAVVAEEVRNLARRSAEAARNTTAMIEEAIVRSQAGKQKLDDVSGLIAAVTANVESIQSLSEEVNASSGNQARAIQEIAGAVAELQTVTQQIAANVQENAAASEELTAQAATVDAAIGDVSHMLGGVGAASRIAGRAPVERGVGMFVWSSRFEIGIEAVDAQHQRLFGLARQLYNAMNAGLGREVLARLLQELLQYTETHFAYEERLMRDSGYPDYAQHKARHDALTEKVRRFAAEFQAGRASVSIELMGFLRDWLSDHILKSDLAYQPHLQKSGVVANSRS